jgi:NAD(P)H-hydrate repair Nnr-like enzyme with NAD(P)H-hydrate dehydratase domain
VLKGVGSVIAHPDGALDINTTGNATLSVAGSGDALAGLVGAFLAQAIDARTALRYAVCLHGAAADALLARGLGPIGVSTGEVIDAARDLLNAAAHRRRGASAGAPDERR